MKIYWRAVLLSYSSLLLQGLSDNVRGPLFSDILKDFSLSDSYGSWMFALSSGAALLGSLLTAKSIVSIGRLGMFRLSIGLLALAQFGLFLSRNFTEFLVASFFFGAAIGIMGVLQSVLIAVGSPKEMQSRLMSGLQSMYAMSSLLAPVLISWAVHLSDVAAPWRMTFLITGYFSTFLFLLTFIGKESLESGVSEEKETMSRHQTPLKEMIYVGATLGLYVLSEIMVSTRAALVARREHHFSLTESAWVLGAFFIFMLIGRGSFSFIQRQLPLKKVLLASLIGGIACILLGLWSSPWFLSLAGLFMAPYYPIYMVAAARLFKSSIDVAMSIAVAMSFLLSMAMHITVGSMTESIGLRSALLVGPVASLIAVILLLSYGKFFGQNRDLILKNEQKP